MRNGFKDKIKYFFSESVRPRGFEEYSAVFLRGLKADDRKLSCNKTGPRVPWLYLRVLAFGFIAFAIVVLAYRVCNGSSDFMATVLYGALFFNLATLVFFYELYPDNDLSLLLLILIVLVGGAVACAVISFGYEFIYNDPFMSNPWVSLIWTAFWEELVKGAVAICAVLLLKNKNPVYCFLIGFAVGTGYSYLEDLGYIYAYTAGRHYEWAVLMSVGRGLSCAFSHAPWTAIICYAFAKYEKPYLNFRFYLFVLASMVLHYFADVPFFAEEVEFLKGFNLGWLIEAVVVVSIVAFEYFALKYPGGDGCRVETPVLSAPLAGVKKLNHISNVTALLCGVVVSALVLTGCALDIGERRVYDEIYDDNEFVTLIQGGNKLKADWQREYDASAENYMQIVVDGAELRLVQRETEGETEYFYYYGKSEDGGYFLTNIAAKVDGAVYYCEVLEVYDNGTCYYMYGYPSRVDFIPQEPVEPDEPSEPEEPDEPDEPDEPPVLVKSVTYYAVEDVAFSYDTDKGCYRIRREEGVFQGLGAAIALGVLTCAVAGGGIAAVIILKKKIGRFGYDR